MKNPILFLVIFLIHSTVFSQNNAPKSFSWQGVFRNGDMILDNSTVEITFTIIEDFDDCDGEGNIDEVYIEEHLGENTNQFGLLNLYLGEGNTQAGIWEDLNWGRTCYFLKIDAIVNGNEVDLGMSKIVGTPYTKYNGDWVNVGDSILYRNDVKIGIGIDNPLAYLDVVSPSTTEKTVLARFLNPGENTLFINQYGGATNLVQLAAINSEQNLSLVTSHINNLDESTSTGIYIKSGGNVGIGTTNPNADLHVIDSDISLSGGGGILVGNLNGNNLAIDQNEIMARENGGTARLNLQAEGGEIRVHSIQSESTQFVIKDDGKVGIGVNDPEQPLHIRKSNGDAQIRLERIGNNAGYSTIGGNGDGFVVGHFNASTGGYKRDMIVHHGGLVEVNILKINGADIIEKVNSKDFISPGEVIVIDPIQPNEVVKSQKAYDKTVLGVVSGAGGIKHGVELSQEGLLDGNVAFAIAGRVYVKVTGRVQPGDLLTTSNTPGKAMKAKNYRKARGAIIGKALSYSNDEGMVLMLVNQQ